jgi:hypothetical protein
MKVKERYNELAKKHKLPAFDKIDKEFEISVIDKEAFLLREIRRKIIEKLESYAKFLEEILQPETTLSNMYEAKIFDDEERTEIFKLYKKLMSFDRSSLEISIDEDDEKTSEYITSIFDEWSDMKKKIAEFLKKSKEEWLKETDIKEELRYMG